MFLENSNRMRDLTAPGEAENAVLGKKTVFGIVMTDLRDEGFSLKRSRNAGSPFPNHIELVLKMQLPYKCFYFSIKIQSEIT